MQGTLRGGLARHNRAGWSRSIVRSRGFSHVDLALLAAMALGSTLLQPAKARSIYLDHGLYSTEVSAVHACGSPRCFRLNANPTHAEICRAGAPPSHVPWPASWIIYAGSYGQNSYYKAYSYCQGISRYRNRCPDDWLTDPGTGACSLSFPEVDKNRGPHQCGDRDAGNNASNPINAASGNKYQTESDYRSAGGELRFERHYNSQLSADVGIGAGWSATYLQHLDIDGASVDLHQSTGRNELFTCAGIGTCTGDADTVTQVIREAGGYTINRADDSVEQYNASGQLRSITTRVGRQYTLSYNASAQLSQVTGPFGRTLELAYDANGRVDTLTTPDGDYTYQYDARGNLSSVSYPDGTNRGYIYDYVPYPNALTGITDENGDRFASWQYDGRGRATSSQHGSGADLVTLGYNADGTTTVTDALGATRTYTFSTQHGVFKVASISGDQCTSCGGQSQATTYDANGYVASRTDWNGNVTHYVHNARGLEESRTEAAGTPQQRTITTQWHASFRLPTLIAEPGKTTAFAYDAVTGNLLTRTETDTATSAQRITTFTYTAEGLVDTIDGPRTDVSDVTDYDYDAAGNRIQVTNALNHITRITAHDGSGRPLTIVDPNTVTTTLTYDARGRLRTRTVAGAQTTFDYDNVGQLTRITLPNGVFLDYTYDAAHRLTGVEDNLGNRIAYGLDAMGNRTAEQIYDPGSVLTRTQTRVYDQLSRVREVVGANNQTTRYEYDDNGNQTLITDPLNRPTRSDYDPLDRLIATTDPLQGQTAYGYDNQDNLTTVTDPRGLITTYTYNGLGDLITQASPDTGTTTYTTDAAGNRSSQTDARGITADYTYDALNRLTAIQYPTASLNVTYTYDDPGAGNGIGRLTAMSDASGNTIYSYDARGNVITENRVIQGVTYLTRYGYDGADNLIRITYPGGRIVDYALDATGRVAGVTTTANGATHTVASDIRYLPFGPMQSATLGNGVLTKHSYDLDYRLTHIDSGAVQSLTYTYDDAHNITHITNKLDSSRSQTLGYDNLDRLTSASGVYGSLGYGYDAVGNRSSRTEGASTDAYTYDSLSNRLLSVSGPNADTLGYDNAGNLTQSTAVAYGYDDTNRLIQATAGSGTSNYTYNGKGERLVKTTATQTTVFHYDLQGNLIAESDQWSDAARISLSEWPETGYRAE